MPDSRPDASPRRALPVAYHTLLDALDEGVVLQDARGALHFANPGARRLLGLDAEALGPVRLPWSGGELSGRGATGLPIDDLFRTGRSVQGRIVALHRPGGPRRWLAIHAHPLWSDAAGTATLRRRPDGEPRPPSAAVVTLRDVTAIRRDRQRLARQARFRTGVIRLIEGALQGGPDTGFYQRVLDAAIEVMPGAQAGTLALRAGDGRFAFRAAVGYALDRLQRSQLVESGGSDAQDAARPAIERRNGRARFTPTDAGVWSEAGPSQPCAVRLTVPVVLSGRTLAVLTLDNFDRADAFDGEALDMGRIFATLVGSLWQRFQLERDHRSDRAQLEYHALHDALTGLPNRPLLHDRARQAMAASLRSGRPIALVLLELDDGARVADTLGPAVAEPLLRQVAARLRDHVREADTVARWGGDQFALLLTGLRSVEDAGPVAEKIASLLAEPFLIGGRTVRSGVTVGVDVYPHQATTAEELVRHADTALYRAKVQGLGRARFFTDEMDAHHHERLDTVRALRGALGRDELALHFEPRVALDTAEVTGVVVRPHWRRAGADLLPLSAVADVAEQSGVMLELGRATLDRACASLRAWEADGTPTRITVPIPAGVLAEGDLTDAVAHALARHRLDPGRVEIEVPVAAAVRDLERGADTLGRLRALGVRVALGGVATGAAPLAQLARWAPTALTLDAELVAALPEDPRRSPPEAGAVRALMALGRGLSCTVVAEGVATPGQREALARIGCHEAQGPLFSRPLPASMVAGVLRRVRLDPA